MGPIEQLAHQLMQREMNKPNRDWEAPKASPKPSASPIDPEIAALIGHGVDAFGTYQALKRPGVVEANPMMSKLFGNSPAKTGLGVAATGLAGMLARKLLAEDGWQGKLSDIIAGQSGADGLSFGIHNLQQSADKLDPRNVFERSADQQREAVVGRE